MTPAQRFQQIEVTIQAIGESQLRTQAVIEAVARAQTSTQEALAGIAASISRYVDAADARMRRLDENLDGLIRAITAEHSNGKSHN